MVRIAPPARLPRKECNMMDWDKLRIFHAVADAGSLTQSAQLDG